MIFDRSRSTGLRVRAAAVVGALALSGLLGACGSGSTSTAAGGPSGAASSTTDDTRQMRGDRYCEVLLVTFDGGSATGDVWNTYPLNDCPQAVWTGLDAKSIAAENGVPIAKLNGPRYWLMNSVEKVGGVANLPEKDFGGLGMYLQATVAIGSLATASVPYVTHAVSRSSVFVYDAGQRIYELRSPDGRTFVMQTYSVQIDPTLTEAGLTDLGSRLALPEGWVYSSRVLDAPLRVETTSTAADVLQDELGNSYSQVTG